MDVDYSMNYSQLDDISLKNDINDSFMFSNLGINDSVFDGLDPIDGSSMPEDSTSKINFIGSENLDDGSFTGPTGRKKMSLLKF